MCNIRKSDSPNGLKLFCLFVNSRLTKKNLSALSKNLISKRTFPVFLRLPAVKLIWGADLSQSSLLFLNLKTRKLMGGKHPINLRAALFVARMSSQRRLRTSQRRGGQQRRRPGEELHSWDPIPVFQRCFLFLSLQIMEFRNPLYAPHLHQHVRTLELPSSISILNWFSVTRFPSRNPFFRIKKWRPW